MAGQKGHYKLHATGNRYSCCVLAEDLGWTDSLNDSGGAMSDCLCYPL